MWLDSTLLLLAFAGLVLLGGSAIIVRRLKLACILFAIHSAYLGTVLFLITGDPEGIYMHYLIAAMFLWPLLWAIERTSGYEEPPVLGVITSSTIIIIIMFFSNIFYHFEPLQSGYASIIVMGIYGMVARRDIVKIAIGFNLIENGVHLFTIHLVTFGPQTPYIALVLDSATILLNIVVAWIIVGIYSEYKSLNSWKIARLRW
ncbi:NADH-quinone oxidoreductase subunit K [Candidatus Bathyarchaeota archaeon]|nr:NADH-quinone oxidoreductase subunit K [Candidatus Bathyarchaeota archaeon]